eukprot:TRINITY_DN2814_c0_g1_i4.p1 TRINITY_DN2814_c0_g1~~TRINITY_DN2814_c0_g1_i4.p1  ORF type:complete len:650 (-),score=119.18 TRINITY_DN2814_c0_g1_i4:76-2025(-)
MEGYSEPENLCGIIPRAFEHVFRHIEGMPNKQFLVRASFVELYNEELRDLLSKKYDKAKLELREKPDIGVYIKDLSTHIIQNSIEMKDKLAQGKKNRHVGETKMNQDSSRSHSVFTVIVECCEVYSDGQQHITVGKLNMVDLAGSERQSKTHATGVRFQEAININQSLTTLGNVISALVDDKKTHIPYRDSKLTRILQDSLGGNTKTVMIANVGPADYNYEETLSTLRYAYRAKSIKNQPKINEDPKDTMIREYQSEITKLKEQLQQKMGGYVGMTADGKKIIEVEKIIRIDDEEKMKEIEERMQQEKMMIEQDFEKERAQIIAQQNIAENEKQTLLQEINQKEDKQNLMMKNQKKMFRKIQQMEQKLLQGDQMKEKALLQEKELKKAKLELEERLQNERRVKEQLEKANEAFTLAGADMTSLDREISTKTEKFNTLLEKIEETKQQKNEMQSYRVREKEILLEENRDFMRDIRLYDKIIELFIPLDETESIKSRIVFSEEKDDFILKPFEPSNLVRPRSALNLKRPTCEFARVAMALGDTNPRYRHDNIMQMDLDLPEPTIEIFDGIPSQKLQESIDIALNDDQDSQVTSSELQQQSMIPRPNIYIDPQDFSKQFLEMTKAKEIFKEGEQKTNSAQRRPQSGKKRTKK